MIAGSRPRVLHVRSSNLLLGAEQVVLELLKNSFEFDIESSLLVIKDPEDAETELYRAAKTSGITVTELECGAFPTRSVLKELKQICTFDSIDLVHCHGYKEDILIWLAGIQLPKVATNHLWKRTNSKLWIYSLIDAVSLRSFNHIIAVSSQIQRDMNRLGIPNSKMSLILNGIDVESISSSATDLKYIGTSLGIKENTVVIASLSSLTPEKGIDVLLNAIGNIRKMPEISELSYKVLVIGDGPERERLEVMIADLQLNEFVTMVGHRSDARELLKLVDIFVLPSRNEGLPISLLEAMASNCGVIATDVGEVSSVITEPNHGVLVKANDVEGISLAISDFLKDHEKLELFKSNSYQRVKEKFSAFEMTRQYCEIYTKEIHNFQD
ncbi:glycosyltransferase family 4 protein [Marinobacter sp. CHS3-4]|uniref:glycosyltransferase family 4 protein n=1 Tax=Marinobacter sp. CHS3-4 TaxID=3045174 RepID=UPI0024B4C9BA|nr:glycosyltransferase family 4 protein [Marinobacter sp. CHS3-4]MDI9245585.1 glycosyltransferase family 4 protein [Marinobacter sp. CHS3-4]